MYFFALDAIPFDHNTTDHIYPYALVTYVMSGATERVDWATTMDDLGKVSWSRTAIAVKNYTIEEIDHINFGFRLFSSAGDSSTILNQSYKQLVGTLQYEDGTIYKSQDFITQYDQVSYGEYLMYSCVRNYP